MSDAAIRGELYLAWEGADHPDGPWHHLRVLELAGQEAISAPYLYTLEVVHDGQGADVDVDDLVGARAALKVFTKTEPTERIVHGVITAADEIELDDGLSSGRYRLALRPPTFRTTMMRKSSIYLEKTLRQIIEQVLQRTSLGAALVPSQSPRPLGLTDALTHYTPPKLTYAWAIEDVSRLDDVTARPYCVQYCESDFAFLSRLLEEEGIAYHFEHGDDECVMVLTDFDGGRIDRSGEAPCGPKILGREVFGFRASGRLQPRSVHLDDYNWRKPNLELNAISRSGVTDFTDMVYPGRYEETVAQGKTLATVREERADSERRRAQARTHCRLLTAGTIFTLDHPVAKFSGTYLVTALQSRAIQHEFAGDEGAPPYEAVLEVVPCGKGASRAPSRFRPRHGTPRPRIYGSQTARVTADPSDPNAEINVGGPNDLGCVRLKFHWDMDGGRHAQEPTSRWVRVSQFFAGADHGALWHPRVGDEVIVEFIDGDPDRPIVTGRVYNGTNPAPENATQRPTYSAIKSNTSPHNGNYNLIAFEDLQGSEQIIIHAARDWVTNVERNCSRGVGVDEDVHIKGDQQYIVDGSQRKTVGVERSMIAGTSITNSAPKIVNMAGDTFTAIAGVNLYCTAGSMAVLSAPVTKVTASMLYLSGSSILTAAGAMVTVTADGSLVVQGGTVLVAGGDVTINGGTINVNGGTVNVNSGGNVNVKGADIHLN